VKRKKQQADLAQKTRSAKKPKSIRTQHLYEPEKNGLFRSHGHEPARSYKTK